MARKGTRTSAAHDAPTTWAPAGTLTIDTVAGHWTTLQVHLGAGRPLSVDLAAIQRVDTAGVQLLLQARRVAAAVGQSLHVQGLAMAAETRRLLGISEEAAIAAQMTPADVTGQEG